MPADDGLHGMPAEDLAAFLHSLRALREREGLSLDGADLPPGRGPPARAVAAGARDWSASRRWPWPWPGWPPGAPC